MNIKRISYILIIVVLSVFCAVFSSYADSSVIDSGSCGENASFVLTSDGTMTISGYGQVTSPVLTVYNTAVKKLVIDDGITGIGNSAFWGYTAIKDVVLSDSILSIETNAFTGCTSLVNIRIPNVIEFLAGINIQQSPFKYTVYNNCGYLGNDENPYLVLCYCSDKTISSITVNTNTRIIFSGAFRDCTNLTEVMLPCTIKHIGSSAFLNCNIQNLNIPDGCLSISVLAFGNNSNLTDISLPNSLETLDSGAFQSCPKKSITYRDSSHVHNWEHHVTCASTTSDGIVWDECSVCNQVKHSYTISSVKDVTLSAISFEHNGSVQKPEITITKSNNTILNSFYYDVNYSGDCTSIGTYDITVTLKNGYEGTFNLQYQITEEYFPDIPDGSMGDNITYSFKKGVLTISGSGPMKDYKFPGTYIEYQKGYIIFTNPLKSFKAYIKEIVIEEGITTIGDFDFFDLNNLISVSLPNSLTDIGYYAFYNCEKLQNITLPDSIQNISNFAFYGCGLLSDMSIPANCVCENRALEYEGDNQAFASTWERRLASELDYLNNEYLSSENNIAFTYWNITDADKQIIDSVLDSILENVSSDSERVDAIGNFIANNLSYNANYSDYAGDVLRHLKGVCAGHNQLTAAFLKAAGYPTAIVSGIKYANDTIGNTFVDTSKGNHQWVMTYFDEAWHLIDTTTNYTKIDDFASMKNWYICGNIDGVMPISEDEDFMKLGIRFRGAKYYYNDYYHSKLDINGFSANIVSMYNNGALWASKILPVALYYDDSLISKESSDFEFDVLNSNGLHRSKTYPNVDGKICVGNDYGVAIWISNLFDACPYYEGYRYIVKGMAVPFLGVDSFGDDISFVSGNKSVFTVDSKGIIHALGSGKASFEIKRNGITFYGCTLIVVNSASEIPTNTILKTYCNHTYHVEEYSDLVCASELSDGSCTVDENCIYCGKEIVSYEAMTSAIKSVELCCTEFEYDKNCHYPGVIVKDASGNILREYHDYTVQYEDYPISVGTHSLTVKFINRYEGSKKLSYEITKSNKIGEWYEFDEATSTLTIDNISEIPDYDELSDRVWDSYSDQIKTIIIKSGVSKIGSNAFASFNTLTSVQLPDSVTQINSGAFMECVSLSSISVPSNVTTISAMSFKGCIGLKTVTLYETLETICEDAFSGCTSIDTVIFDNLVDAFNSITILDGNDPIKNARLQSTKGSGSILSQKNINKNAWYVLTEDGRLTINGTGDITLYISNIASYTSATSIVINEGITGVYGSMGSGSNVTFISLPNSLKTIGKNCFNYARKLINIEFGTGLENLGDSAFAGCSSLLSVDLPDTITEIPNACFNACNSLSQFSFDNITCIGSYGLSKTSLGAVTLPSTVKIISECAFSYSKLNSIVLPDGLCEIGKDAFANNNLVSVIVPSSVSNIGAGAFMNCNSLKYAYIPSTTAIEINGLGGPFYNDESVNIVTDAIGEKWPVEFNYIKSSIYTKRDCPVYVGYTASDFAYLVEEFKYTINYVYSGKSILPSDTAKQYIFDMTISTSVPGNDNGIFMGWAASENGEVILSPGGTIPKELCLQNDGNVTLYAVYKIVDVAITDDGYSITIYKDIDKINVMKVLYDENGKFIGLEIDTITIEKGVATEVKSETEFNKMFVTDGIITPMSSAVFK